MSQFGNLYSQYYDLLYRDKDYLNEAEYVMKLIIDNFPSAKTILEFGCGTGRHAEIFCEKGFIVHGVDMSRDMLEIAKTRLKGREDKLSFSCSAIQDLKLDKQFDVVLALFHVMSYQVNNDELIEAFNIAKKHLNGGGIFIFDFWYGPGVLTDLPSIRIKRLENENIKVTRIAEPVIYPQKNIVDVNYDLFIEDKNTKTIIETKELHKMRYFFDTELKMICDKVGFSIINKYEWMTNKNPDFNSWNVVWIIGN